MVSGLIVEGNVLLALQSIKPACRLVVGKWNEMDGDREWRKMKVIVDSNEYLSRGPCLGVSGRTCFDSDMDC